jgi:hypothetical protein
MLASDFFGIGENDEVEGWDRKAAKYVAVKEPEVVKLYNKSKGGVDLLD